MQDEASHAATNPALKLVLEGPIAWIEAHNIARMNAFTAAMWEALPGLIRRAEAEAAVRVVILRGAGTKTFSAGADISEFDSARSGDAAKAYDVLNHKAFASISECSKPTIAMIHGFCLGGGLALAVCCDMRLADDKATFSIPAAKLGIGYNPRWIRPLLTVVSPARAKEILFTGRRFSVIETAGMGLVNRITSEAELEADTRSLAAEIAGNAPLSIIAAKRGIDELTRHPEHPDLASLDALVEQCFASADYAEGRRAFSEKRKPKFEGR